MLSLEDGAGVQKEILLPGQPWEGGEEPFHVLFYPQGEPLRLAGIRREGTKIAKVRNPSLPSEALSGEAGPPFFTPSGDSPAWKVILTPGGEVMTLPRPPKTEEAALWLIKGHSRARERSAGEILLQGGGKSLLYPGAIPPGSFQWTLPLDQDMLPLETITFTAPPGVDFGRGELIIPPRSQAPLPVDPGLLLSLDSSSWRGEDFEVYSWGGKPEVIILIFKTRRIQSRYLKRLAFFAEKPQGRGRLLRDEELAPWQDWNGHDYPPETLAAYFSLAGALQFPLSPEEKALRELVLDLGMIHPGEEGFSPGRGIFLSLSLEGDYWARKGLLTHELAHGVYFSQRAWREKTRGLWEALEEEQQALWRHFLAWAGYDIQDEVLVQNEFQAYLLQRPVEEALEYWGWKLNGLKGQARALKEKLLKEDPELFSRQAREINAAFRLLTGLEAGRFGLLERPQTPASP